MASLWRLLHTESEADVALTALDPAVVGYMQQQEGGYDGVNESDWKEIWHEGSVESVVNFGSKEAKVAFEKNYTFYQHSLVQVSLDIRSRCRGLVGKKIKRISRKRRDLSVRVIDGRVVLCGTQQAVDDQVGALEYEIMGEYCDRSCVVCGSQATAEYTSIEEEEEKQHSSYAKYKHVYPLTEAESEQHSLKSFDMPAKSFTTVKNLEKIFDDIPRSPKVPTTFMKISMANSKISLKKNVDVFVYKGDITKLSVDAVVCPVGTTMDLSRGIGKVIAEAVGLRLEEKCVLYRTEHGNLAEGKSVVLSGAHDKLQCHHVILVNPGYKRSGYLTGPQISTAIGAALHQVKMLGAVSVALPLIGTGSGGVQSSVFAKAFCAALKTHLSTFSPINSCHVVGVDPYQVKEAHKIISDEFSPSMVSWIWKSSLDTLSSVLSLP